MQLLGANHTRLFEVLESVGQQNGVRIFIVGGVVRDFFLGRAVNEQDLDFMVEGNAIDFATAFAQEIGGSLKKFSDFVTAKILKPTKFPQVSEIDFASARSENYPTPGALPVVTLSTVENDLKRRDFSINAMALPITALIKKTEKLDLQSQIARVRPALLDYFGGLDDLTNKLIRVLHERSFIDDPTRIFRAARYTVRIEGTVETSTLKLINEAIAGSALNTISEQRKVNEIKKSLKERHWARALTLLNDWGVLSQIEILSRIPSDRFLSAFLRLETKSIDFDKIDRFEVLLALAIALGPVNQQGEVFSKIGVSKKKFQAFSDLRNYSDSKALTAKVSPELGDLAVVTTSLLNDEGDWEQELRRRKLIKEA